MPPLWLAFFALKVAAESLTVYTPPKGAFPYRALPWFLKDNRLVIVNWPVVVPCPGSDDKVEETIGDDGVMKRGKMPKGGLSSLSRVQVDAILEGFEEESDEKRLRIVRAADVQDRSGELYPAPPCIASLT